LAKEETMPTFVEMDDKTAVHAQMEEEVRGPVVLVNQFTIEPDEADKFLKLWAEDAAIMKRQPGFIFTQMHKGIGSSRVFLNVAIWESIGAFKRAFSNPEFQARIRAYPPSVVTSPHLFQKIAVPGICVA